MNANIATSDQTRRTLIVRDVEPYHEADEVAALIARAYEGLGDEYRYVNHGHGWVVVITHHDTQPKRRT